MALFGRQSESRGVLMNSIPVEILIAAIVVFLFCFWSVICLYDWWINRPAKGRYFVNWVKDDFQYGFTNDPAATNRYTTEGWVELNRKQFDIVMKVEAEKKDEL
jgi:hypothetical protein